MGVRCFKNVGNIYNYEYVTWYGACVVTVLTFLPRDAILAHYMP